MPDASNISRSGVPYENALIVEGGAMRSVFSAGLLDGFLKQKFNPFDCYIGVSAGAYNLAMYMADMPGKSLEMFLNYGLHKNFISFTRFLRGGHLLDLDWLFEESMADTQLDLNAVYQSGKPLIVGTTDVLTGKPVYTHTTADNFKQVLKASTALPLIYRNFPKIDDRPMTDGGVSDGIPVTKAIELGAKRIMVIRSRHKHYMKKDTPGHRFIRWKLRNYSSLVDTMQQRVLMHKKVIDLIRNPPSNVTITEVCPPDDFSMGRFTRDKELYKQGYQAGMQTAIIAINEWIALSKHNESHENLRT